jgi:hypothetical protein
VLPLPNVEGWGGSTGLEPRIRLQVVLNAFSNLGARQINTVFVILLILWVTFHGGGCERHWCLRYDVLWFMYIGSDVSEEIAVCFRIVNWAKRDHKAKGCSRIQSYKRDTGRRYRDRGQKQESLRGPRCLIGSLSANVRFVLPVSVGLFSRATYSTSLKVRGRLPQTCGTYNICQITPCLCVFVLILFSHCLQLPHQGSYHWYTNCME